MTAPAGDAAALLALIHQYADLLEAAPSEGECGSPLTAERLRAAAVTIEAESRARLGLTLPSPADLRDLVDVSRLVDNTAGCPVSPCCHSCDTTWDLSAVLVTTPVGIVCVTLCQDCENAGTPPAPPSLEAAYLQVLHHAGHIGLELPHLTSVAAEMNAAAGDGCPKCTKLHFPWCDPYGGPGYTQAAIAREEAS